MVKGRAERAPDEEEGYYGVGVAVTVRTDTPMGDGQRTRDARIVVLGDGDISSNSGISYPGHVNFLLNSMAWLSESEELIAIRPTGEEDPPIILTKSEEQLIAWVATLGLLQVIAAAGIVVHGYRRRFQ